MKFNMETAILFVPDGLSEEKALARTTHLAISAHQDDLEIMATNPILQCFQQPDKWFTGVVVTDGRGSPRESLYKEYTDEEMRLVRFKEQQKAAVIGEYAAQIILDYPSKAVKNGRDQAPVEDLFAILKATHPEVVYTHNLADKHDTHVGVALRTIAALRRLPPAEQPKAVYGCEIWRDLDWMVDADKVLFDCSAHENLQAALLGVFDSQIAGGKRYDLATQGRRQANATYFATHGTDTTTSLSYGIDLTPLLIDPNKDIAAFIQEFVNRFSQEITDRFSRLR
jgi:LmbE family N-acetylglucosaminyl deacetylase